jgi:hypothetical protein
VRHISADLMNFSWDQDILKRNIEIIRLYSKTGKEWTSKNHFNLDLNNFQKADQCFNVAYTVFKKF